MDAVQLSDAAPFAGPTVRQYASSVSIGRATGENKNCTQLKFTIPGEQSIRTRVMYASVVFGYIDYLQSGMKRDVTCQ